MKSGGAKYVRQGSPRSAAKDAPARRRPAPQHRGVRRVQVIHDQLCAGCEAADSSEGVVEGREDREGRAIAHRSWTVRIAASPEWGMAGASPN